MFTLPPLNALRCLEAAARLGSFSRAAAELNITQSAISHQMRQLEDWFGTPLFTRQARTATPTEKGRELARTLTDAFDIIHNATKRAKASDTTLTVAALPSIATIWLIPRLESFYRANPSIPIRVIYLIHGQSVDFSDIDFAITWSKGSSPTNAPDIAATKLFSGDTVAVANPVLLETLNAVSVPENVVSAPLLHDTDRKGWLTFLRKAGVLHPANDKGPIFEDFNMLRAAALASQGLALCPRSMIADDIEAGRLVQLWTNTAINEDHAYWLLEQRRPGQDTNSATAFRKWISTASRALTFDR